MKIPDTIPSLKSLTEADGPQAVQKARPARPQRVKTGGGTHRTSWGRSPIHWILANGKTPPVFPPSGNLNRYVEDLNDARTPLADFVNSLLEESLRNNNDVARMS